MLVNGLEVEVDGGVDLQPGVDCVLPVVLAQVILHEEGKVGRGAQDAPPARPYRSARGQAFGPGVPRLEHNLCAAANR